MERTTEKQVKKWYQSKTIWLGVSAVVSAACAAVAGGAGWQAVILAAVGAAGVYLRTVTDKAVEK